MARERGVFRIPASGLLPLSAGAAGLATLGAEARWRPRVADGPAGEHVVEFRFRQPRFHPGLGITAATAIATLLIVLAPARHDRAGRVH